MARHDLARTPRVVPLCVAAMLLLMAVALLLLLEMQLAAQPRDSRF